MTENLQTGSTRDRLWRSARVLKSYFEQKLKVSLELLTAAPAEAFIDGVQFTQTIARWGLWGVRSSRPLSEGAQTEISVTFHELLSAMERLEDRRGELVQVEARLQKLSRDDGRPANVIPLRRRGLPAARTVSVVRDEGKRWILRLDCLIESIHVSEIHKMALELHSQSLRYAFVEYRTLTKSARASVSELLQMGAISLFVPSLLDLTLAEQQTLRALVQQDTLQRPLLMVGAMCPYSDLRSEPAVDLELLLLLARAYIKLTRPFAEYKDKGLIHYFLDSLSQSPT